MSKYLELVESSFTQEHFDKQKSQNPYVAYSIKDDKVIYYKLLYTMYKIVNKDISNCTYNMVDLGLPSGLKWADRNVGATDPEHYGSYFQWGDTTPYTFDGAGEVTPAKLASLLQPLVGDEMEVTKDNVEDILLMLFEGYDVGTDLINTPMGALGYSVDNKLFNWNSYFDTTDGGSTFNKYYNNNGGLTVLESIDDAATAHMGSQYRMPTFAEIEELRNNTTHTFIDLDGIEYSQEQVENGMIKPGKLKGVRFTGSNGNSIFIPAAGSCYYSLLNEIGMFGCLWSSSCLSDGGRDTDFLAFGLNGIYIANTYRCLGFSVRGVQA